MTVNYQKGQIYKIVNNINDKYYIGHTASTLSKRFHRHKTEMSILGPGNRRLFQEVKKLGGWDEFRIILIERYPCLDKDEMRKREQYHIDHAEHPGNLLNNVRAYASPEVKKQRNAEARKRNYDNYVIYNRKHRLENKAHYDKYLHDYYEKNKAYLKTKSAQDYQYTKTWGGDMSGRWGPNNLLNIKMDVFQ